MTQRIQPQAPSPELLQATGVRPAPEGAMERAWPWGYVAICLLALAAAGAIARGGVANVELRMAGVAVDATRVFGDVCIDQSDPDPLHIPDRAYLTASKPA